MKPLKHLSAWYHDMGVTDPAFHQSEKTPARALPPAPVPEPFVTRSEAVQAAQTLASQCTTLAELRQAVEQFDGCALKRTATHTVFCDGNPNASIMLIGEAPGAQEDAQAIPFCGESGQLLTRMFAALGLEREKDLYITNSIFWRPPGNRKPTEEELAICSAFLQRHIALKAPKLIFLVGATAVSAVLNSTTSMAKLRRKMLSYQAPGMDAPIPTFAIFHPAYLLRQPLQKKQLWFDLLSLQPHLEPLSIH